MSRSYGYLLSKEIASYILKIHQREFLSVSAKYVLKKFVTEI